MLHSVCQVPTCGPAMDESYYLRHILKSKTIDIDPEMESFTWISDHINHEPNNMGRG